jgi:hypothetical protein
MAAAIEAIPSGGGVSKGYGAALASYNTLPGNTPTPVDTFDMSADDIEDAAPTVSGTASKYIGWFAFYHNPSIRDVVVPDGTTIGSGAFIESSLRSFACESGGTWSIDPSSNYDTMMYETKNSGRGGAGYMSPFSGARNLTTLDLTGLDSTSLNTLFDQGKAFQNCKQLQNIILPSTTINNMEQGTFASCSALTSLVFPSLKEIRFNANYQANEPFIWCTMLETVDLGPDITYIDGDNNVSAYRGGLFGSRCYSLKKLIIRNTSQVATLTAARLFNAYNDSSTGGVLSSDFRIYVPDDLVDAYKAASNWSAYAAYIVPLSDLS